MRYVVGYQYSDSRFARRSELARGQVQHIFRRNRMHARMTLVLVAFGTLLIPHFAAAQDEEVSVSVSNRTSTMMQVFALWDGRQTIRLGDLAGNQSRDFDVTIRGQELSLAVRVLAQGQRSERVGADNPEDFVTVRPGDQIEWEIRRVDPLEIFLEKFTSGSGEIAAFTGPSVYDAEIVEGQEPRVSRYTALSAMAIQQAQDQEDLGLQAQGYRSALDEIMQGLANETDNPEAYLHLGIAHAALGNYMSADSAFDRAEALYPEYLTQEEGGTQIYRLNGWITAYNEAVGFVDAQDAAAAVEYFQLANALYDKRAEAYINAGGQMVGLGDLEGSIENFRMAIAVIDSPDGDPGDDATRQAWDEQFWPTAHFNLGQVLGMLERHDEAVTVYETLLEREPDNAQARSSLALALTRTGQGGSAVTIFDEILASDDAAPLDYFNAGVSLYGADELERAVIGFQKALERSPMYRDALQNVAQTLSLLGNTEAQVPYSARVLELDPYNAYVYSMHIRALSESGLQEETVAALELLQALPFSIDNLQIQPTNSGANIFGQAFNRTMAPGSEITLTFTFYDDSGSPIGTQDVDVTVSDPDVGFDFQLSFSADHVVLGYSYEVGS